MDISTYFNQNIELNDNEYVLVIDGLPDEDDMSIFTQDEWDNLTKISKLITYHANCITSDSDDAYTRTNKKYRADAYYLYYHGYHYGFIGEIVENYNLKISDLIVENNNIKIKPYPNKFRNWICEHYIELMDVYHRLQQCNY